MPSPPAICRDNGHVFPVSSIQVGDGGTFILGTGTSQCPICGSVADIPGGIYQAVGDAITAIANSPQSEARLRAIIESLETLRSEGADGEKVVGRLRLLAPELSGLFDFLLSARGAALAAWITLVVVILTSAWPQAKTEPQSFGPTDIQRIVTSAIQAVEHDRSSDQVSRRDDRQRDESQGDDKRVGPDRNPAGGRDGRKKPTRRKHGRQVR